MPGREWTIENGCPRRSLVMLANASIQAATTPQGAPLCAAFDGFPAHVAASPRLDTRFRGYDTSWLGGSMQRLFRGAA
jgi:hypothetical protein